MNNDLPRGWASVKLEEIVTAQKGKKPAVLSNSPTDGFVPYLDIHAIEKNEVRQFAEVKSSKLAARNDLFVVWDGARSGWVGGGITGAIGSTIMALTPQQVESSYLRYFITSQFQTINANPRGTGLPHIEPEIFWNLEVPLAPLAEQRRIVAKLELLLGQVAACQQRLDKIPVMLKRFRQSVLAAACSGHLTADWRSHEPISTQTIESSQEILIQRLDFCESKEEREKYGRIFDDLHIDEIIDENGWLSLKAELVCDFITKGTTPKTSELKPIGDVPYIKVYNIADNKIDFKSKPQYISKEIHQTVLKRSIVYPNDVLMNIVGPPLGKVAIVPDQFPEWNINQALAIFRPIKAVMPEFLYVSLLGSKSLRKIITETRGIVGQSNISLEQCRALDVNVPPLVEQEEIVRRVESLFALADNIEQRYKKAQAFIDKLTPSLLAKAFRGELVPQDPNDEPASVLLGRIKGDKQEKPKGKHGKEAR